MKNVFNNWNRLRRNHAIYLDREEFIKTVGIPPTLDCILLRRHIPTIEKGISDKDRVNRIKESYSLSNLAWYDKRELERYVMSGKREGLGNYAGNIRR